MAIAHDASSDSGGGTGDLTWDHTPVGTPRGVVIVVIQNNDNDSVDGVTYAGLSLTRLEHAVDAAGEDGGAYLYWAGSSIPTDNPASCVVSQTETIGRIAGCYTLTTAGVDVEVEASDILEGDQDDPSITLTTGAGVETWVVSGLYSGQGALNSTAAGTGFTKHINNDGGAFTRFTEIIDTPDSGSNVTVGWTTNASDDVAMVAGAFKEAAGGGPTGKHISLALTGVGI